MSSTDPPGSAATEPPEWGYMPKSGLMTMGDGTETPGPPYVSDPYRRMEPSVSYTSTPEELAALRERARDAEAKTHTRSPDGVDRIGHERRRQILSEGWTPEHDAEHTDGALIKAAVTYAREALWAVQHPDVEFDPTLALTIRDHQGTPASTWPWDAKWWKPNADPVLNLVKAGALIAAEIDRLVAAKPVDLLPAPEAVDA